MAPSWKRAMVSTAATAVGAALALVAVASLGSLSWVQAVTGWVVATGLVAGCFGAMAHFWPDPVSADGEAGATRSTAVDAAAIIDELPDPILVVDRQRRVLLVNPATVSWLGTDATGRDLSLVVRHPDVLAAVDQILDGRADLREESFQLAGTPLRHFTVRILTLGSSPATDRVALILLREVTAERRAEAMRADFVANASHELRTPLAGLIGFIETLQGPAKDDSAAAERFLAMMREQAQRMARLVRDLLSLSRIELNEHTLPKDRVDLVAVARRVAELSELRAQGRQMTIDVQTDLARAEIFGDEDELEQVVQNLVDNAFAYGRPGSPITIRVDSRRDGESMLTVIDQGDGIAPEHLPRLTERFYRADSARSRSMGGTGLGLAIVKHIVNRHRGQLLIKSTVGEGSQFSVVFRAVPTVIEPSSVRSN